MNDIYLHVQRMFRMYAEEDLVASILSSAALGDKNHKQGPRIWINGFCSGYPATIDIDDSYSWLAD